MSSITFNTRTPSPTSSSSASTSETKKENEVIQLDWFQECMFERKIQANYIFESKDKSISFSFNLQEFLKRLIMAFKEEGIKIERLPLIGSQMGDVILKKERPHHDKDFLVLIQKDKSIYEVKDIFLRFLFRFSGIESHNLPDGKILCFLNNQKVLKVNRIEDVFGLGALDALGAHGNIMPITLPMIDFKIDLTIAWDLDASCLFSSNCFQGDCYPYLTGAGKLNQVTAADGYNGQRSSELLGQGFFYIEDQRALKIRDGARGYVHAITSGIFPVEYSKEEDFLQRWIQDYPTAEERVGFLTKLIKHFEKHYKSEPHFTSAYLINLRTFFASKKFEGMEAWLDYFDTFAAPYIGSPRELETILFWNFSGNPTECRLDCCKNSLPARFRVHLPLGSLLIEAPWIQTLTLLTSSTLPNIPPFFQGLYSKGAILARLANMPPMDHPVAKLLTYLVRGNFNTFIPEFARYYVHVAQFETLLSQLSPKFAFPFGSTPLTFLSAACKAGFVAQSKTALSCIDIPENPTTEEIEIIFSILPDIKSWRILATRAPNLIRDRLIKFIIQNPDLVEEFFNDPIFKPFYLEVARKLPNSDIAWNFLADNDPTSLPPSLKLLNKIQKLPPSNWSNTWLDFIEQNPALLETFVQSSTFSSDFHLKAIERCLKVESQFHLAWKVGCANGCLPEESKEISTRMKKACPHEFTKGLLQLFEINSDLAAKWSRLFFKTAPFTAIEKSAVDCWRLLQLCSKRPVRSTPLSTSEIIGFLKLILKSEGDLLNVLSGLIKNDSLTVYHRTDLVIDLFSFTKFLLTNQQLANRSSFIQNFFTLIITLFEDPLFIEKRKVIFQLLSAFTGPALPLPSLQNAIDKPFNECLVPLATDFEQSNEMLRYFIHWLIPSNYEEAKTILASFSKTGTMEQLFPEDAPILMGISESPSESIVKLTLSIWNPKQVLTYLEKQTVPCSHLALYEKFTLSVTDLTVAIKLGLEIKRLGGQDMIPAILTKKVTFTAEHLPLLERFKDTYAALIWKVALPSFTERNILFQLQIANLCKQQTSEINLHFAEILKGKIPPQVIGDLIRSELIQLNSLWTAVKPYIKDQKILKLFIGRLSSSTNIQANFKILAKICKIVPPESNHLLTVFFSQLVEKIKDWTPVDFWAQIQPLLQNPTVFSYFSIDMWSRILYLSQAGFRKYKLDEDTLKFIPELVKILANSPLNSVHTAIYLEEVISDTQMIQSESVTIDQAWQVIEYLPSSRVHIDAIFQRLSTSTDYAFNFKLLNRVIQKIHFIFLEKKPAELFSLYIQKMKYFSPKDFWSAINPMITLKGINVLIPEIEFEKAFSITLDRLHEQENKEKNIEFLDSLTTQLIKSPIWSESVLLFLARGLNISITTPSITTKIIWERLVSLAPKTIKTVKMHEETGAIFSRIFKIFNQNTLLILHPEFVSRFTWTQTPLPNREKLMLEFENLLQQPPADFAAQWLEKWSQLNQVQWELPDYARFLTFLQKIIQMGDYSLAITTQYILNFEFGKFLSQNINNKLLRFEETIFQFHKVYLESYPVYMKLLEAKETGTELIQAKVIKEFTAYSLAYAYAPTSVIRKLTDETPEKLSRNYLLLRAISMHATILYIGQSSAKQDPQLSVPYYIKLGKELFEEIKKLNFFNLFELSSINSILRELFENFSNGTLEDMNYLPRELTSLIQHEKLFTTLNINEKRALFSTFLTDMQNTGRVTLQIMEAAFEFTKNALQIKEWELTTSMAPIQIANTQFLAIFNKFGDVEKAFLSAENLTPLLSKYLFKHEQFVNEIADKIAKNEVDADFHQSMYTLIDAAVKNHEVEHAVDNAVKVPHLAKRAAVFRTTYKKQ